MINKIYRKNRCVLVNKLISGNKHNSYASQMTSCVCACNVWIVLNINKREIFGVRVKSLFTS